MTTKTTKYSIITSISLAAILITISMSSSAIASNNDGNFEVGIDRVSPMDAAQANGLPYLESKVIDSNLKVKSGSQVINYEIIFHSDSNPNASVTFSPNVDGQFIVLDSAKESTTLTERAEAAASGKTIDGMIAKSDLVKFSTDEITLMAGQSETITVTVSLPEQLAELYQDGPFRANISIDVIDSTGFEKLPRNLESVELEGVKIAN